MQQLIQQPGVCLMLPSLIDNAFYTMIEATQHQVPMITTNVGDVKRMLRFQLGDRCTVLKAGDVAELSRCLDAVLHSGSHFARSLSEGYNQPNAWLELHRQSLQSRHQTAWQSTQAADISLSTLSVGSAGGRTVIFAQLRRRLCPTTGATTWIEEQHLDNVTPVALIPNNYQWKHSESVSTSLLRDLLSVPRRRHMRRQAGGYVFGVRWHDQQTMAYPASPTWTAFGPDDGVCDHTPPVTLVRNSSCAVTSRYSDAVSDTFNLPHLEDMYRRQGFERGPFHPFCSSVQHLFVLSSSTQAATFERSTM